PVVAASAFAATVGGPQIAVTAGVLGLASLAYDSYSNRDQRHTELAKYAWSLIDDVRPQFDILSDPMHLAAAASHAMYLMKEGENQYKIMGSKLEAAQKNFNAFWENYQSKRISPLILSGAIKNEWRMEAFMRQTEQEEQQYGKSLQHMDSLERRYEQLSSEHADLGKIYNDGLSEWNNACAAGKPVFEFMRRLVHTGNYIQCPYIIHLATLDKLATGYPRPQTSSTASTFDDILSSWDGAQHYRKVLAEISDAKKAAETNFKELNNFLASPARKMVFPHITIMS
ncbi:MAG: hypothetical protein RLZZ584_4191, partial [Pseudomonadota bacterium]